MLANGYPLNVIHNIWHIEYYIIILLHHELFLSLSSVSIDILIEQGGGSVLREILCCSNMTHVQYICVPLSNCQFTRQLNLGAELYSVWHDKGLARVGAVGDIVRSTKRQRERERREKTNYLKPPSNNPLNLIRSQLYIVNLQMSYLSKL